MYKHETKGDGGHWEWLLICSELILYSALPIQHLPPLDTYTNSKHTYISFLLHETKGDGGHWEWPLICSVLILYSALPPIQNIPLDTYTNNTHTYISSFLLHDIKRYGGHLKFLLHKHTLTNTYIAPFLTSEPSSFPHSLINDKTFHS